jgi:hypothetical protein
MENLGTQALAVSQEDTAPDKAAAFLRGFEPAPAFPITADLQRGKTTALDRTTAYWVDAEGVVRQVFPMLIHSRPSLDAILGEIERLTKP